MNLEELTPERRELWKRLFGTTSPELLKTFRAFHLQNPHVMAAFTRKAREARAAGHQKYSAWIIVNVLRWESDLRTTSTTYRIANDHISLYARLLVWNDPTFEGFFDLKQMKPTRSSKPNTLEQKEVA